MRFNRNIYMRLYQIAFFIPNIKTDEKEDQYYKTIVPLDSVVYSDNIVLRDKCFDIIYSLDSTKNEEGFRKVASFMEISYFEMNLFYVCLAIYEKLFFLFSPYEKDFKQSKRKEVFMEYNLEEDPEGFYEYVYKESHNSISAKEIKEKTFEMFSSLKSSCIFYCKFAPSYSLYGCSFFFKTHENEIPVFKKIKEDVALFFGNCPINRKGYLITALLGIVDSSMVFLECKNLVEERIKEETDKKDWDKRLEKLLFGVICKCMDISEFLSAKPRFSYKDFISHSKDNLVKKDELTRRKRISDTQNNRLYERKRQVKNHIKGIMILMKHKNISKRKACKAYFDEHKSELKAIHITSQRTLENICSTKESNKQRSAFSNMAFLKPVYSPAIEKKIKEISHDYLLEPGNDNMPNINVFYESLNNR